MAETKKEIGKTEKTETQAAQAVKFRTPGALLAAKTGKKTFIVNIAKRYRGDNARSIQVDDLPRAVVPTEEDVEVCEAEYFELKRSAELRRDTNRLLERLERTAGEP